jgi:hypothetical protein
MLWLQTVLAAAMTSAIDVQQQWLCEAMLVSSDEETDEEATPLRRGRLLPGSVSSYDRAVSVMGTPDRKQLHNLRQQLQSFLREGVPVHERSQRFSAGLPVWRPRMLWLSTSLNSLCLRRPSRPKPGLRAVKLGTLTLTLTLTLAVAVTLALALTLTRSSWAAAWRGGGRTRRSGWARSSTCAKSATRASSAASPRTASTP